MTNLPNSLPAAERAAHRAKWGSYNDPPPNLTRIEPSEFWAEFARYGFSERREFRLFVIPLEGEPAWIQSVHLLFGAGDAGFAITAASRDHGRTYEPKFYKFFLCEHAIEHVATTGNCLNRYRCSKCGWTYEVDSSG